MDARALLGLGPLLVGCLASPALEPLSGFELATAPPQAAWSALAPEELAAWLAEARARLAPLRDYRAVLETRERIGDELYPRRVLHVLLRHEPFGVAIETAEPPGERGQRVWFDAREGELVAETPGLLGRLVGRVSLDPEGDLALRNRRHPITDTGLLRLLEQVEEALAPALARTPPPRVRWTAAVLGARPARLVECELERAAPEPALGYRLGFDAERGLLVSFGLAELRADGPALIEEYLYRDLEPNPGLADGDFRPPE